MLRHSRLVLQNQGPKSKQTRYVVFALIVCSLSGESARIRLQASLSESESMQVPVVEQTKATRVQLGLRAYR